MYLNNGVHTALLKTKIGGWDAGVLLTSLVGLKYVASDQKSDSAAAQLHHYVPDRPGKSLGVFGGDIKEYQGPRIWMQMPKR